MFTTGLNTTKILSLHYMPICKAYKKKLNKTRLYNVLTAQISPSDTTQRSEEWFSLRKDRLTASAFSNALGFWKGTRRAELWSEKVFASESQFVELEASKQATEWGIIKEAVAVESYKTITGHDISFIGFAIHPEQTLDWLGASPDGLLSCSSENGILEVKCPFNKGKLELVSRYSECVENEDIGISYMVFCMSFGGKM